MPELAGYPKLLFQPKHFPKIAKADQHRPKTDHLSRNADQQLPFVRFFAPVSLNPTPETGQQPRFVRRKKAKDDQLPRFVTR